MRTRLETADKLGKGRPRAPLTHLDEYLAEAHWDPRQNVWNWEAQPTEDGAEPLFFISDEAATAAQLHLTDLNSAKIYVKLLRDALNHGLPQERRYRPTWIILRYDKIPSSPNFHHHAYGYPNHGAETPIATRALIGPGTEIKDGPIAPEDATVIFATPQEHRSPAYDGERLLLIVQFIRARIR